MAGSAYSGESDTIISEINVTPLVDVVLVLLIVMMITMPTIVGIDMANERELEIALPEAGAAKPLTVKPQNVYINIARDGAYTVQTVRKTPAELADMLRRLHADNPGRESLVIRADKQTPWQAVVTVIDLCDAAKIRGYRVTTNE
ncbi:MAG: biopolymer transporter ExbD [Pirellulales bacterium]